MSLPLCVSLSFLSLLGKSKIHSIINNITIFRYVNPTVQTRKIALVVPGILFTTIVITPNDLLPSNLVWNLLEESVVRYSLIDIVNYPYLLQYFIGSGDFSDNLSSLRLSGGIRPTDVFS